MAVAGRVAIVPKGEWSADVTYKRLDAVTYNNTLYFAKKDVPAGTATSNTEYWSKSIVGGVGAIATKEDAGIVKPADGLSIAEDGTLKVSIDGTTLTMDQVNNVIKLADTLKEKIGSALQPESIVNNQITTVEGFALDARQANPDLDGTLAKQISDLNGSLKLRELTKILYNDKVIVINGCISGNTKVATFMYPNHIVPSRIEIDVNINVYNYEIVKTVGYNLYDDVLSVTIEKPCVAGAMCGLNVKLFYD